jgi:hypothetical protein
MEQKKPDGGKIITFYSYKGGTGRSMSLANIAWILASQGRRVLVLDWDLEAPGLHRYFHPFLTDKELTASDGIIDFVIKFATAATTPHLLPKEQGSGGENTETASGAVSPDWYKPQDRDYRKLRIRSDRPIALSKIVWRNYNQRDRK